MSSPNRRKLKIVNYFYEINEKVRLAPNGINTCGYVPCFIVARWREMSANKQYEQQVLYKVKIGSPGNDAVIETVEQSMLARDHIPSVYTYDQIIENSKIGWKI